MLTACRWTRIIRCCPNVTVAQVRFKRRMFGDMTSCRRVVDGTMDGTSRRWPYRRLVATNGTWQWLRTSGPRCTSASSQDGHRCALTTRSTRTPTGGASRLGGRRLPWFVRHLTYGALNAHSRRRDRPSFKEAAESGELSRRRATASLCPKIRAAKSTPEALRMPMKILKMLASFQLKLSGFTSARASRRRSRRPKTRPSAGNCSLS